MCEGLLCVRRTVPPAAAPPAPAQLRGDGINMIVPMGVILGCVTMAGVVLMLWLVHHRIDRGAGAPARQAADEEEAHRGRRCSLESYCGAPHLPKLPVIIVLPDNKSLSLGWQLEHTPRASPTAALCAREGGCSSGRSALENGKQAATGGNPRSSAASSAPSPAAGGGAAGEAFPAAMLAAIGADAMAAGDEQQQAGRPRWRPPLVSVLVLGPDHTPVVQPPTPSAKPSVSLEGQPELRCLGAQPYAVAP